MIIDESEILLCIASCTHLSMLFDINRQKSAKERDAQYFDPNDEILLRLFVIPELVDSLKAGQLDTDQCMSKTEMVLRWSLGEHLEREGHRLTSSVFEGMMNLYDKMIKADFEDWWNYIPEEHRDENRKLLIEKENAHTLNLDEWRFRRSQHP